jgi:hypothetical protein
MVQEVNWMVRHRSEELAQLMLMQEIIDTLPARPLLTLTFTHIHILSHAADLLEEQA